MELISSHPHSKECELFKGCPIKLVLNLCSFLCRLISGNAAITLPLFSLLTQREIGLTISERVIELLGCAIPFILKKVSIVNSG